MPPPVVRLILLAKLDIPGFHPCQQQLTLAMASAVLEMPGRESRLTLRAWLWPRTAASGFLTSTGHTSASSAPRAAWSLLSSLHTVTDFMGQSNYDTATGAIASSKGVPNAGIVPADNCSFLGFNVNSELGKFRLHNGGAQDQYLLNEKEGELGPCPFAPIQAGREGVFPVQPPR